MKEKALKVMKEMKRIIDYSEHALFDIYSLFFSAIFLAFCLCVGLFPIVVICGLLWKLVTFIF